MDLTKSEAGKSFKNRLLDELAKAKEAAVTAYNEKEDGGPDKPSAYKNAMTDMEAEAFAIEDDDGNNDDDDGNNNDDDDDDSSD